MRQKKKWGQVFLKDNNMQKKIVDVSGCDNQSIVVEIGCGEGDLSEWLVKRSRYVYIVEIDPDCKRETQERLSAFSNFSFIDGDILKVGLAAIQEESFSVVANIPYNITAKIIKMLIRYKRRLRHATLLVQAEFADKLIALPNTDSYTSLGIYTSYHFKVKKNLFVPKTCFKPIPKVDSAVITLEPRRTPLFDVDEPLFFSIIRTAFWGRRKTLLKGLLNSPYVQIDDKIKMCPFFIDRPQVRGEVLSIVEFYEIYQQIHPYCRLP